MLSIRYPDAYQFISNDFHGGLLPLKFSSQEGIKLIIKAPKEHLLTAKLRGGFKLYLIPVNVNGQKSISLMTAFLDNEDEPRIIKTPLFSDDLSETFREMFFSKNIEVYLFDENNFEYLGYGAHIECPPSTKKAIEIAEFIPFSEKAAKEVFAQMDRWFGHRRAEDDDAALSVVFGDPLYPEDTFFIDARGTEKRYISRHSIAYNHLERMEAGEFQERDIANLLARVFPPHRIYLNPLRMEDSEEISDILVVGERNMLFIQAKDSPNIERVIDNSVLRKKSTTLKHLDKALSQMSGAVKYARKYERMCFLIGEREFSVRTSEVRIAGLIVVKELFQDEYDEYTKRTMAVAQAMAASCIPLEYTELHSYTKNLRTEDSLLSAIDTVFNEGLETGMFPRLRFGLSDDADD